MSALFIVCGALLLDLALGDPALSFHPVRLIGKLAQAIEGAMRRTRLPPFAAGACGWLITVGVPTVDAALLAWLGWMVGGRIGYLAVGAFLLYCSIAPRDLAMHALAVKRALGRDGLDAGRKAVSMIVGRDVEALDEAGVIRACVESVAESTVDGIAAPIFWTLLLGPAGAIAYRAANTLDSMWGHKDEQYLLFGRFAARADDAANWLPARIAFFVSIAASAVLGLDPASALRLGWRDRRKHESPNAAWLEASFSGALGLRLGGPCRYSGQVVDKPFLGEERRAPETRDIARAVALMYATTILFSALGVLVFALVSAAASSW
jgi:adenosylcobinamide-phosphate synthase